MDNFKHLFFIFPVMAYYFMESLISAIFINIAWRFVLEDYTQISINYFQWVVLIWIFKVVFFDVFKLINGLGTVSDPNVNNEDDEI